MAERIIYELGSKGRRAVDLPELDVPGGNLDAILPAGARRRTVPMLPEVDELELIRHFVRLSALNHHVEKGFYPLGSCTMKANPPVNEVLASLPGFTGAHPLWPARLIQGSLRLMAELECMLAEICGLHAVTLQPAAGAHGELTGLMVVRAYHENRGNPRKRVIIPDSAHGTNPASASLVGYETVEIKSDPDGLVDLAALERVLDEDTAVFMLTNPNTLGLFERRICQIQKMVHAKGALLYMDGANMNALLGIVRPGDTGFDLVHLNLHKTFSTPHGGGGPGSGPLVVSKRLEPFLPVPRIACRQDGTYEWDWDRPQSIGKVMTWWGNFAVLVRAYAYIRALGGAGLAEVSEGAILNANYLLALVGDRFDLPYSGPCMHEFVLSGDRQKKRGIRTLDMAKRLLDKGVHAPTVYFPIIVSEGMMIEPTETESRESVESFARALLEVADEVEHDPDLVHGAPYTTPVSRLDETRAARQPDLAYKRRGA
ncbi:MAG: aminomethyl-transferring glycine dehydrogenase subunit GcvPB [Candidatus Eisenbacteria bacterium]|jgi:glycine dehydrogenase subunit 2|nr:aminomethyl-transferring glycine dehydrogenase subunit GcvPB [Candidatus Eisenbacteria bacterium]